VRQLKAALFPALLTVQSIGELMAVVGLNLFHPERRNLNGMT